MTPESVEHIAKAIGSFGTCIAWTGFWLGLGMAIIGIGIAVHRQ